MHHPTDSVAHTPIVEHWLEQKIDLCVAHTTLLFVFVFVCCCGDFGGVFYTSRGALAGTRNRSMCSTYHVVVFVYVCLLLWGFWWVYFYFLYQSWSTGWNEKFAIRFNGKLLNRL